jgi:hypothetical protein
MQPLSAVRVHIKLGVGMEKGKERGKIGEKE